MPTPHNKYRKLGLCWDCPSKPFPGYSRCLKHLLQNSRLKKDWRLSNPTEYLEVYKKEKEKRKQKGRCTRCGAPVEDPGFVKCVNCRAHIPSVPDRFGEIQLCNS